MDRFYMVYVEGMNMPSKKWENIRDAEKEAERLCEKEKRKVFILKSIQKFEMKNVEQTMLYPIALELELK